jgi:hypothetical protein
MHVAVANKESSTGASSSSTPCSLASRKMVIAGSRLRNLL